MAILYTLREEFTSFSNQWLEHIRSADSRDPSFFKKENEDKFLPAIYKFALIVNDLRTNSINEVRTEHDQMIAKMESTKKRLYIVTLGTALLGLFMTSNISRTIFIPVRKMLEGMSLIKSGDLTTRIHYPKKNELGSLTKSFNSMTANLRRLEEEWHRQEESISQSEYRFRSLFEGSSEAILLGTKDGLIDCNPAFLKLFGYDTFDEIKHLQPADFSPERQFNGEASGKAAENKIDETFRNGTCHFEWLHRKKNGEIFISEVLATSIRLKDQVVIQCMIRNISERKAAEIELKKARDEAEKANKAKSEFLSRISHELRTPLNNIIGFSSLMEMSNLPQKEIGNAKRIQAAGRHLLDLINDVLDISRIESGKILLTPEPVHLGSLLQEIVELMEPVAKERNISIRSQFDKDTSLYGLTDRQRMRQVLLNLFSNGIKYNRDGGVLTITLKLTGEKRALIEVQDTGHGIPSNKMDRLFTPFDRLNAEQLYSSIEGTGLGLALSKKLVDEMNGRLVARSKEGEGSVFSVEITVTESVKHQDTKQLQVQKTETSHEEKALKSSFSILYVEDNADNLQLLEEIIELRPNVKCISATMGKLGIEMARAHQPDLIILDLNLPDINGEEVLRQLKRNDSTGEIPVYILTADVMGKRREGLISLGALGYLIKPLDVVYFLKLLDKYIDQVRMKHPV